ncbi:Fic family protein [Sphingopyxis sp. YF1]|uniref:Fic family protein n=1 Tax=Sphingopyxis sp. YF1 TaxID=2482763 RepID=UPI001F6029E5|nr:Fic family protein [Sphingopyxis sp. YF1]UNU44498.1 Fic family protein [Sphingopyxis sp. YF1]
MTDISLDKLLDISRAHPATDQEKREQEISFVIGNENISGHAIHRGTVTIAMPRVSREVRGSVIVGEDKPSLPEEIGGLARQYRFIQNLAERRAAGEEVPITPDLVCQLHAVLGSGRNPAFGAYRTVDVEMLGSEHRPVPPDEVAAAVQALCDDLAASWSDVEAIALSAYALWRLNWIHPFIDANGRTARALCYLILNLKFEMLLPGTPILVEQLKERREDFFDTLTTADLSYQRTGEANLAPLGNLIEELLFRQLRSLPALSEREEDQLAKIVARRIEPLPPAVRQQLFGGVDIAFRSWSIGDYFLLYVTSAAALVEAETLTSRFGQPFPGLLAMPGERATVSLRASERGTIARPRTFEVRDGAALWLEPNGAVTLEQPSVALQRQYGLPINWSLSGTLYVVRKGDDLTEFWANDIIDMLVSRHIQGAH